MSLGYQVKTDGTILQEETDPEGKKTWKQFSKLGARRAVLNDLSPAATFIAYNYNTPVDVAAFEREAKRILKEVEEECGWMYETMHTDGKTKAHIDYTVWSEVFSCPECSGEIVFLQEALDLITKKVRDAFPCPHCNVILTKKLLERQNESVYDTTIGQTVKHTRRKPALIVYRVNKVKYEKVPDYDDVKLLQRINSEDVEFPRDKMMHSPDGVDVWGDKWRSGTASFTHVHHLFISRALVSLSALWSKLHSVPELRVQCFVKYCFEQAIMGLSLLNRYGPTHFSQVNRHMNGVYYVASQHSECSPWYNLGGKIKRLCKAFALENTGYVFAAGTGDSAQLSIKQNSLDYIFVDPPFGDNLAYGELNFIIEAFHKVFTNMLSEAVVSRHQRKQVTEYQTLMKRCFNEFYRILKPGRWITVEFSNTKASIWNSIQNAMADAGFIISNVSALDKKQGSFNAVTNTTSVKQDLVISAYKPNGGFEERFQKEAESEEGVWDFVRTHMKYLPVTKQQGGVVQPVPERDPRILYDQMLAYYVRHGFPVPLSSQEFQGGLAQRFIPRDGMYFLSDQAAEYDKCSAKHGRPAQMSLFVSDEASAIDWLRNLLGNKPQTISDLTPQFMKELGGWSKHEKQLDLRDLLNQNFLCYDGKGPVPEQIHAYLSTNWKECRNKEKADPELQGKAKDRWYVPDPNKAGDLEKLRERALLREFWEYLPEGHKPQVKIDTSGDLPGLVIPQTKITTGKRIKVLRTEAIRAGFKYCWQHQDYRTIIAVAKRIPEDVLQEDAKLLMWYDQALTRLGEE